MSLLSATVAILFLIGIFLVYKLFTSHSISRTTARSKTDWSDIFDLSNFSNSEDD